MFEFAGRELQYYGGLALRTGRMEFRRAVSDDYPAIFEMQNRNLRSRLTVSERSDGFLSAAFRIEDYVALNDDLCVVVCAEEKKVLGFVVASTLEFNQKFDLSKAMMARYRHAMYDGKTLDSYQSCVAGPVCVEREQRGRGIVEGLYHRMFELLPPEYELAVALVSKDNPRSLNAHIKIGFKPMEQFQFNGRTFDILAIKR